MDNDNPAAKFREMSVAEVLERLRRTPNHDTIEGRSELSVTRQLAIWKITQLADQLEEAEQRIARMKALNFDEANGPPWPIVDWREINRLAAQRTGPNWVTVSTPQGFKAVPEEEAHLYAPWPPERLNELLESAQRNSEALARQQATLTLQGEQIKLLRELVSCLRVVLSLHLSGGSTLLERAREITQNLERL